MSSAVGALCSSPVAVLGIGDMGLGLALRLRDAGQAVQVHDLDPASCELAGAAEARASRLGLNPQATLAVIEQSSGQS